MHGFPEAAILFLMMTGTTAPSSPPTGIDTSIVVSIIALVSSVSGIVIANRYTSRNAREAAAKSATVEQGKLDEQRRQSLMDTMQEEINRIDAMRKADREEYKRVRDEDKAEFQAHKLDCTARIRTLEEDQAALSRERTFLSQQVDALVQWSRAVVRVMRNANVTYPAPPPGVDTDTDGFPPIRAKH